MSMHDTTVTKRLSQAEALSGRAMRHANAGDLQAALPLLRQAEQDIRPLVEILPAARLELAVVLNDLALVLAWLGRPAEALTPLREAIALHRARLAATPPIDAGTRHAAGPADVGFLLANSLDSLGSRLAALGRHREAATAQREAITHYRDALAAAQTDVRAWELARALNNLSIRCADLEEHEEALEASREAVDLYHRVPSADPEQLTGLTHATANLALRLARLDHRAEAPGVAARAIELIARLPEPHPRSQLAALADSLTWLAWYLRRTGHPLRARSAARTARDLRRRA
ncbi:tetratricopeptide repeat protein [Amycolatopsis rhizosphaerae]|uniref:Tetratricopeptide repeat protein n=1 Tax=Amycolatopsis rhizosphaerae TaxID=2053003 RepID=A0A558BWY6_9PSEU|nr:tetratricopeptide repeat protein [Amycolatopsis rhizosphaerae]TVT41036.1 tetratricopeptide repeat protein [Amycolatopsis rhizosphaerae]